MEIVCILILPGATFSLYVYGDTKGEKHTQYRIRHVTVSRAVPGILTPVSYYFTTVN